MVKTNEYQFKRKGDKFLLTDETELGIKDIRTLRNNHEKSTGQIDNAIADIEKKMEQMTSQIENLKEQREFHVKKQAEVEKFMKSQKLPIQDPAEAKAEEEELSKYREIFSRKANEHPNALVNHANGKDASEFFMKSILEEVGGEAHPDKVSKVVQQELTKFSKGQKAEEKSSE